MEFLHKYCSTTLRESPLKSLMTQVLSFRTDDDAIFAATFFPGVIQKLSQSSR